MACAALHCTFVLLLYLEIVHGQQTVSNNQNVGGNNPGSQQQSIQWTTNNINQNPNGGLNLNMVQQSNKQSTKSQQSAAKQGNIQQSVNLSPNIQSQTISAPQNGFQITKIGFTPVSSSPTNNACSSSMQSQNGVVKPISPQNVPISNTAVTQMSNAPISTSTLAELLAIKGQSSLLSLLNPQNNCQSQQNQQLVVPNSIPGQNQLTDAQKQFLMRSLQSNQQTLGQTQQAVNFVQSQPSVGNMGSQGITVRTVQTAPQGQVIVTPLGNQPPYVTVQAQPLTSYLQYQVSPQVTKEEEPSIISLIMSELDPQYSAYPQSKKSKPNLKTLIPLIINMLKEKNSCNCRNCGCPNNACQNNGTSNNMMVDPMAQVFGGYSSQKKYGSDSDSSSKTKKKEDEPKNSDKEKKNKKPVVVESEEYSDENDSEYIDDEDA